MVFNESLLTPYKEPEYPSQQQPDKPPPVIINDVEEFEVEEILDSRMYRRKLQLVLPWLGLAYFNKVQITQDSLLQMLRSKM